MRNIFPVIIIIAAILFVIVFVHPRYVGLAEVKSQRDELSRALDSATQLKKQGELLRGIYSEIPQSTLERLEKFLPSNIDNVKLIIEIEKMAREQNLALTNVNVASPEEMQNQNNGDNEDDEFTQRYGTVEIAFTTTGTYENFVEFLSRLEKNLRLIDVKTLVFSEIPPTEANPRPSDSPHYIFNVEIQTYWLKN